MTEDCYRWEARYRRSSPWPHATLKPWEWTEWYFGSSWMTLNSRVRTLVEANWYYSIFVIGESITCLSSEVQAEWRPIQE